MKAYLIKYVTWKKKMIRIYELIIKLIYIYKK